MMLLKKEREIEGRLGGTVEFRCGGDVTLADQGRHRKFPWAADKPIHMSQGSMDTAYLSYLKCISSYTTTVLFPVMITFYIGKKR